MVDTVLHGSTFKIVQLLRFVWTAVEEGCSSLLFAWTDKLHLFCWIDTAWFKVGGHSVAPFRALRASHAIQTEFACGPVFVGPARGLCACMVAPRMASRKSGEFSRSRVVITAGSSADATH